MPTDRARALARDLVWPRGDRLAELQDRLRAVVEPELEALEARVLHLRRIVDRVATEPGRYPTRVLTLAPDHPPDTTELERWIPGDTLEVAGRAPRIDEVAHGYPPAEGHAIARGDILDRLEQQVTDLRRWLFDQDPDEAEEEMARVLSLLPEAALEALEHRRGEWKADLARREAWLQETLEFLEGELAGAGAATEQGDRPEER